MYVFIFLICKIITKKFRYLLTEFNNMVIIKNIYTNKRSMKNVANISEKPQTSNKMFVFFCNSAKYNLQSIRRIKTSGFANFFVFFVLFFRLIFLEIE
jgi:hypothetical protein